MSLFWRVYYNAVFGGLGGLLAWLLYGAFFDRKASGAGHWLLAGAIIGAAIGYLVVSVDAIRDRSLLKFAKLGSYGLVLGGVGGAVGYLLGEILFKALIEPLGAGRDASFMYDIGAGAVRGVGWMLLGLAVGISEGIAARSLGKFSYGAIGGTIGGFLGGMIYGAFYSNANRLGQPTLVWGAVGLVILGASIGSLMALVRAVFVPASVKVMRGWQEGREYPLDKPNNLLGRDEHVDIALFRDMRVEKKHCYIQRDGNRFLLVNNGAPADYTRVNGAAVPYYQELHDGDRIELGQVILRFQLRTAQNRRRLAAGS